MKKGNFKLCQSSSGSHWLRRYQVERITHVTTADFCLLTSSLIVNLKHWDLSSLPTPTPHFKIVNRDSNFYDLIIFMLQVTNFVLADQSSIIKNHLASCLCE